MNFLLHFHLAARDLGRPESALGAMLPDVWRMADRRARTRLDPGQVASGPTGDPAGWVNDGVSHHVAVDAWFHHADVFTRGELAAREALRAAGPVPKLGLFAHVAWEMCLDGALVRQNGAASILDAVRGSLAAARPDAHHRAARRRTAMPVADLSRFEARVDSILDALARGPWIEGYATATGIVARLEGLRERFGFPAMEARDRIAVEEALTALEADADAGVGTIVTSPCRPASH